MFGREAQPRRKGNADKVTYLTAHGRQVKDGGGISPDVVVKARPIRDLERALLSQGYFYQFAGEWLQNHKGSPQAQAAQLEKDSEATYREFVRYVREAQRQPATASTSEKGASEKAALADAKAGSKPGAKPGAKTGKLPSLLEGSLVSRQLSSVEKTLDPTLSASREKIQQLRQQLLDEELTQFGSQKEAILQDMTEAVLGRLTSPSALILKQLSSDPQVTAALEIARDDARYRQILADFPAREASATPQPSPSPSDDTAA